ncbi:MAG: GGDEF domain-containing protein [Candidatus Nanopelagicales bacterium]
MNAQDQPPSPLPSQRWTASGAGYTRGWTIGLVLSVLVLLLLAAMEPETAARSVVARSTGIIASIVFLAITVRMPREVRWIWLCFFGYLAITVAADVVGDYQLFNDTSPTFPGATDFAYMATYLPAVLGLILLGRLITRNRNIDSWIDALIVTAAGSALVGAWIIGPLLTEAPKVDAAIVVSCFYPALDLLLLAFLVRILFVAPKWNPALALLAASLTLFLISDLYYNALTVAGLSTNERLIEVLWTAALLCLPLAVAAPGAREFNIGQRGTYDQVSLLRASILGFAVLVPPFLVMGQQWRGHSTIATRLSPIVVIVIALLFWRAVRLLMRVRQQAEELESQARTDPLTGLPNRRTWEYEITRMAARMRSAQQPLIVAMLDLDYFKNFNDALGHLRGDELLVEAAQIWQDQLSMDDVLARYGGEEFSLLLPYRSEAEAFIVLEGIRTSTPLGQTISIGFAQLRPDEDPIEAVRRADIALYRAKTQGRDRVVVYEGPEVFFGKEDEYATSLLPRSAAPDA